MPPNFDDKLTIDHHGCVTPAGPLELDKGEKVLRLDAWVIQKHGSCMAFKSGPFDGTRWEINPDPHEDHFGQEFQRGPALGMGLMVSKKADGETVSFWWSEAIQLV